LVGRPIAPHIPATARSVIAFMRIVVDSHAPAGSSTSGLFSHVSSTCAVARSHFSNADFPSAKPNMVMLQCNKDPGAVKGRRCRRS
jgi:hypothetical protein